MTKRVVSTAVIGLAAVALLEAQAPYPRTFTDGSSHTVTLAAKPTRIASTVLGVDENLMDLVDPSRIVAMESRGRRNAVTHIGQVANTAGEPATCPASRRDEEAQLGHTPVGVQNLNLVPIHILTGAPGA